MVCEYIGNGQRPIGNTIEKVLHVSVESACLYKVFAGLRLGIGLSIQVGDRRSANIFKLVPADEIFPHRPLQSIILPSTVPSAAPE